MLPPFSVKVPVPFLTNLRVVVFSLIVVLAEPSTVKTLVVVELIVPVLLKVMLPELALIVESPASVTRPA